MKFHFSVTSFSGGLIGIKYWQNTLPLLTCVSIFSLDVIEQNILKDGQKFKKTLKMLLLIAAFLEKPSIAIKISDSVQKLDLHPAILLVVGK